MKRICIASALLFLRSIGLPGQTPPRPYNIRGPRPTPETVHQAEEQRTILVKGWSITPQEAVKLEARLAGNPEDLQLRLTLMSYYGQYILNQDLLRHITWLISHHPESDAFQNSSSFAHTADPAIPALWKMQADRFPKNSAVLRNAALALSSTDPELALRIVKAAREAEPGNTQLNRWDGQCELHLSPVHLWDGLKSVTLSTPCVVSASRYSRNDA